MNQIGENDLEAPHSFLPHTHPPPPELNSADGTFLHKTSLRKWREFSAQRHWHRHVICSITEIKQYRVKLSKESSVCNPQLNFLPDCVPNYPNKTPHAAS
jgi:hypothetical protein